MRYYEKRTVLPPNQPDSKTYLYVKKYSATTAQEYADQQATSKGVPINLGKRYDYANYAAERIKAGDSPDVIVNTLKREGKWPVSTTTLYCYIEQGYIPGITSKGLLEKSSRKPSRKNKEKKKAARAPKRTSIERRPPEITARKKFGDWEMNTVIGKAKSKKTGFFGADREKNVL